MQDPKEQAQSALEAEQVRAVQVAQNNAAAVVDADPDFDPSLTEGIDASDILIPKLLLMQGLSDLVTQEVVLQGEIVDSVTKKVVLARPRPGEKAGYLEILPLSFSKSIDVSTKAPAVPGRPEEKFKYLETIPFDKQTALLEREEILEDGTTVKRMHAINVAVFLRHQLDDPSAFPYIIKFKSSGYKVGKAVMNHFQKCQMTRRNPFGSSLLLSVDKETKDDNTYWVFKIAEGTRLDRVADAHRLATLKNWAKVMQSSKVRVDNSDEDESPAAPASHNQAEV